MYIYIYIYIYSSHINLIPIHFSSYGNLKVVFETTFRHLSFSSFILTSSNVYTQSSLAVKFYSFEIDYLL